MTRTPEKSFENVHEPFRANYLYLEDQRKGWGHQKLRMHYLREGNPNANEVIYNEIDVSYRFLTN